MNRSVKMLAVLVAVGIAGTACSSGEAAEDGPSIQTVEVTRGDLTIQAEATGTVEPIRSVEVKSKASGEILRLHTDVGDEVAPGALLAQVDPRDVQNRYDQTEADLEVARARVEIAQAQLQRSQELLEADVITEQEHESTRLEAANARASLVKAQTNFDLAELQLEDVTIRAPLAGTIIQKNVEEGVVIQSASQNVSGGTTLFVMANLDQMQVRTMVDETDMGELRAGMPATVRVEAFPDRAFQGVVEKIEPQAEVVQNVTMFPVIVNLDNRTGLLKPGMNAEVEILVDQASDVVLVPNNAVVEVSDAGPAAMVLGIDPETIDVRGLMQQARTSRGGAGGSEGSAAARGDRGGGEATAAADRRARMDSLRARVRRGEISQDSMRTVLQGLRARAGARGGFPAAGQGRRPGAAPASDADAAPARETRPAVVFVMNGQGRPELRLIEIGLNDWDHTQVVSGVEEGETLAVIGAAQLQAQQQEFLNRIRRRGGSPFGR